MIDWITCDKKSDDLNDHRFFVLVIFQLQVI